jgi:hypothetical protein
MARLAEAYICNLHEHWFTLRRIDGQYYNLNSLQDNPTHVGDLYLEYVSSNKLDAPVSILKCMAFVLVGTVYFCTHWFKAAIRSLSLKALFRHRIAHWSIQVCRLSDVKKPGCYVFALRIDAIACVFQHNKATGATYILALLALESNRSQWTTMTTMMMTTMTMTMTMMQ